MAAEKSARIFPDNLAAARAKIAELEAEIARLRKPRLAPQAPPEPEDRSLFEALPQVAFIASPDGMVETLNRRWEEYCGVPADQSLGLNWLAEIHPDDASEFSSHWLQCIHSGECFEREYRLRNRDGEYRWHLARAVPIGSKTGSSRWIGTSTDIHDRKTREQSLKASEERFRLAFHAVEGVVYDWYPKTGLVYRSGSLQKIMGIPPEQAEPTETWWQERVHPEDVAASTLHVISRLSPDQTNFETEFRIRHAQGHWVHVSDRGFVIRDENSVPIRVVGTSQDVTEQRRLERELKATNQQLKFQSDILATTNDAVIALDPNLCIRYCNAAAEKMYGVRLADVVGKPLPAMHGYAFLAPEDEQRTIKDLTERGSWKGEYIHILHNGTQLVVHSTVNVLAPESGGGMVAVIRDVTGRKQAEIQKQNQASQLARANEDLLHFAYAVSHDLQAPVRTIVAFSQMLALTSKASLDEKGAQLLAYLVAAGARMSTMIRDLLEFAQVAGGPVQFSESVSLEDVLETALANLASAIEETGAAITHDPLPTVAGDAGQLAQLFQNLIANSLKYRQPGTPPSIHVSLQQNASEKVVSVHDNGIGFEPHHSERIFGVFQRLHGEQFAGTGIGLTICKRIVERRGGRIWAEGRPGQGASFSFSIPDSIEAIPTAPPMDWDRVHTALENQPAQEISVPAGHFDELFKTLDLAQAIVRKLDGTILIWTKGAERLFGWTASEAVGKQLHELLQTELPIPLAEIEAALLRNGEWTGELKACKRDGSVVWLASLKVLYRDGSGRPQSVIEVHNDITALKDAQAALLRSSAQRDLALRAGHMGVWRWEIETGVVEWSETLERMLGMEPGSFEGTYEAVERRLHPDDQQPLRERIANAFQHGPDYVIENRFLHNNGGYRWVRGQGRVVFDENNRPAGLVGVVWDITERKQSEADWQFLLDLSAKFSLSSDRGQLAGIAVAETAKYLGVLRCVYIEIDRPGNRLLRLADCNTGGASIIGSSPLDRYDGILDEMENGRFVAVSDVAVDPRTAEKCEAAYLSLGTRAFLSVPLHRDGAWVAGISVTSGDIRTWQEREIALLRCIAERLWPAMENARLLQEARERQEQFEATFAQAAVGMAQVGLDGRFLRVNERFCQITGYSNEELLTARFQDITYPDDLAADLQAYQALQQGETQSYSLEKRYFHKTGSIVWINLTVSLVRDSSGAPKYAISVIEDITERKKTAQEALEYADRLSIATSAAQLGVFVWSASSDSTSWENQRVYEIFGRTREAGPLGESEFFEKVLHPHDMVAFQNAVAEAMLPGHSLHTTVRIRRADGELRWIEASGRFDLDQAGTPLRLTGVIADVTDRIAAEQMLRDRTSVLDQMQEAVRQSEERYRLAEWATNDGLWDWNPVTDHCYFSPRFKALLGLQEHELENRAAAVFERLHPDDAPSLFEAIRLHFEERRPYDVEMRMRLKNGQYRWFHTRGQALRDPAGNVTRMIGSISDIQDRNTNIEILRRNQEILEESERKFRELAETLPELLWVADSQGGIVYYNPQWGAYTGLPEGEGLADSWVSIVHPDDIDRLFKTWQTSLANAQHYECEARIRRHDGAYRWFLNRAEPVLNAEGKIVKWIGTSMDIHQRKLTEQALRHSHEDLEQFAYAASHDLQESLRTVSIYSQLLVQRCGGGAPDAVRFAAYLVNATTRMDSLLKGILDYWRLAEPMEGTPSCDSEPILKTALQNLEGAVVTHDVLPRVACPADLMLQLFQNLLGNAVKYRSSRPLQIHVSATPEGRYWKFSFADNGIGIKPEYLQKIFGMFKRLHRDEYPGVGIGLAICKRIVERHGGRIWAESQPAHGATFHFTLPAAEKPPN